MSKEKWREKTEKIGKLLKLLNEYDENRKIGKNGLYKWEEYDPREEYIISKNFGFIKWLVENDKIDTRNLPPIKIAYDSLRYIQDDEEILLMLLAISNSPIEDLVSYLK